MDFKENLFGNISCSYTDAAEKCGCSIAMVLVAVLQPAFFNYLTSFTNTPTTEQTASLPACKAMVKELKLMFVFSFPNYHLNDTGRVGQ